MRNGTIAASLVLVLALLPACTSDDAADSTGDGSSDETPVAESVVASLTPLPGVAYYESGMHESDETSVATGILRFRADSDTEGVWLLAERGSTMVRASDVIPFAILEGEPGFDSELWPLDGEYVAAEGTVASNDDGVARLEVTGLSRVSDMFDWNPRAHDEPGLHFTPDGQMIASGWVGGTVNGVTTLLDRSPAVATAKPIVRVSKTGKGPGPGFFSAVVDQVGFGEVPLAKVVGGGSWRPAPYGGDSFVAEALRIEGPGVKDLLGGRHRVVGVVHSVEPSFENTSGLTIELTEPYSRWTFTLMHVRQIVLEDPSGVIDLDEDERRSIVFAAVEGVLSRGGQRMIVDGFEVIPTSRPSW